MRARTGASARVCSRWIGFVWVHVPPKVRERTRFACYPLVCVHNYAARATSACTYICAAVVCSAGERLGLWRVRASHRNPYSFSFFFLCPSFLAEQYAIAVEKQNRPMNFSEAFIVMHGHSRRGCSINYRLFYCVILVIDISCILAITGIFYALISWNTHMKKMFYWYFIKSWKDYLFSRYSIISFSSM